MTENVGHLFLRSTAAINCLADMDEVDREVFVDRVMFGTALYAIGQRIGIGHRSAQRRYGKAKRQMAEALEHAMGPGACHRCGTPISEERAQRARTKFCSDNCRKRHHETRAKLEKGCPCGNVRDRADNTRAFCPHCNGIDAKGKS